MPSLPTTRIGNEFRVNSRAIDFAGGGNHAAPSVAGLDDGRFLVSWGGLLNGSRQDLTSNGLDILAREFDGSTPLGADFLVNAELRDGQFSPYVASNSQGFIVAYRSGEENSLPGSYAASQAIAPTGGRVGPEVLDQYSYYHNAPVATFLGATDTYVVSSSQEYDYEVQVRNLAGDTINKFSFGFEPKQSAVAQTGDTAFTLFWTGYADGDSTMSGVGERGIYAQSATVNGLVGAPILLSADNPETNPQDTIVATTLASGKIVIATQYYDAYYGDGPPTYDPVNHDVVSWVFDPATGLVVGGGFVNYDTKGDQSSPAVAALDDGGYVMVWQDTGSNSGDGSGSAIRAQVFDANGHPRAPAFLVNQFASGSQGDPSVASIGGDDFVVTWDGPDGVKASIFSADGAAAITGTSGADSLPGTSAADVIDGAAGADVLMGKAGGDTMSGGAGDDTLAGGEGADWIFGGADIDKMTGGAGSDIFVFRAAGEIGNGGTVGTSDIITDFVTGSDRIDLTTLHITYKNITMTQYQSSEVANIDVDLDGIIDARLLIKGAVAASDFIF